MENNDIMKNRYTFVTNSSSASFIIKKIYLSPIQIQQILNAEETVNLWYPGEIDYSEDANGWNVEENEDSVEGWTYMDNFDFHEFLNKIGIPDKHITWGD
jgi:hypothetical protein